MKTIVLSTLLKSGTLKTLLLSVVSGGTATYLFGAIIALLLLIYLVYTLFKPDKF